MKRLFGAVVPVSATLAVVACGGSDSGNVFGGAGGAAGAAGAAAAGGVGGTSGGGSSSGGSAAGGSAGSGGQSSCSKDAECTGGRVCDEPNQRCVDCVESADCSPGALCVGNACLAPVGCSNSLDCVSAAADRKICDPITELCVQCVGAEDCPEHNDCLQNRCVPYLPCVNSLDCKSGLVCDPVTSRCVECVDTADCGADLVCAGGSCRPECVSDNDCTPLGLLCDRAVGYCVECIKQTDCAADKHCSVGQCLPDACPGGAQRCQTSGVSTCTAEGDRWQPVVSCPGQTTCVQAGALAACEPWICTAGATECDSLGQNLIECAADGLSVSKTTDCVAAGQVCADDRCQALVCVPSQDYCVGQELRSCAADGLSFSVAQTCNASQFCDQASAACKAQICTPNQPTCEGTRATKCNAQGSGTNPGGTDCASSGKFCSAGVCVDCQPSVTAAAPLPIDLFIMADETGSMGTDCAVGSTGTSRWCAQINGIYNFLNKPALAGTGVALGTWGASTQICTSHSTPDAAYGLLPANLAAVRNVLDVSSPNGNSVLEGAMRGVIDYTAGSVKPNRNMVGILFSDNHQPFVCETDEAVLAGLVTAHTASTGIPFYWVAMDFISAGEVASVEAMAAGGGVTPHVDYCDATYGSSPCTSYAPADTAPSIEGALASIFKAERSCEFSYPGGVAVAQFSMTYAAGGTGSAVTLGRVNGAAQCGASPAYYLNSNTAPTSVTLCPQLCAAVRADATPVVNTVAACN